MLRIGSHFYKYVRFEIRILLVNKTLEELKRLGKHQLETQLDMLEILLDLPTTEKKDFEIWYRSHPYYKGIFEVVDIVRRGTEEPNGQAKEQRNYGDRAT
jgi:hypothetical protein